MYIDEEDTQTKELEINWPKLKKLSEKLRQLSAYQHHDYTRKALAPLLSGAAIESSALDAVFVKNDVVVADCILNPSPVYDDETLYRLSAYIEPRNAATAVGPIPKELLSPERRQLLEIVASQGEDTVIAQKRLEQKRINRLRQAISDFMDALPKKPVFELQCTVHILLH